MKVCLFCAGCASKLCKELHPKFVTIRWRQWWSQHSMRIRLSPLRAKGELVHVSRELTLNQVFTKGEMQWQNWWSGVSPLGELGDCKDFVIKIFLVPKWMRAMIWHFHISFHLIYIYHKHCTHVLIRVSIPCKKFGANAPTCVVALSFHIYLTLPKAFEKIKVVHCCNT